MAVDDDKHKEFPVIVEASEDQFDADLSRRTKKGGAVEVQSWMEYEDSRGSKDIAHGLVFPSTA